MLTSLIMNRIILQRKYTSKKYLSVIAITIGIILCTLATANLEKVHILSNQLMTSHGVPYQSNTSGFCHGTPEIKLDHFCFLF